ncbi:MAG: hypothetical protein AAF585_19485 [Verrucomicrobiota bacterium]
MSLDGPQLVDGDLAHVLYNGFMDKYDAGADQEELELWAEETLQNWVCDDMEREIWATVFGKAFWEIGMLSEKFRNAAEETIEEGKGITFWSAHGFGDQRKKVLVELLQTISSPNPSPRERKTYAVVNEFTFPINSAFAYRNGDGNYQACILTRIEQYRGECNYGFTPTTYIGGEPPAVGDLKAVLGVKIGYGFSRERAVVEQPGIEVFWEDPVFVSYLNEAEALLPKEMRSTLFVLGLNVTMVEHECLSSFQEQFIPIGQVKIRDGFKAAGSTGSASAFEAFEERNRDIENSKRVFGYLEIPLDRISERP